MKTLLITAAASAAAAFACSKLWVPGTLAAAAFTPVLVAILKEALARSSDVVARAVPPVRGVVRSALPGQSTSSQGAASGAHGSLPSGAAPAPDGGSAAGSAVGSTGPEGRPRNVDAATWAASCGPEAPVPVDPATWAADPARASAAAGHPDLGEPLERVPQMGEVSYNGASPRRRGWRLAIVTGLLGFLVGAVIITVPELVAGGSAAGGGRETTIFGGRTHARTTPATTTTRTVTTQTTPTKTVTAPPAKTVTVPAPTATTTTPVNPTTAPPPAAVPGQTTPAAPPTTTGPVVAEPSVAQPPG